MKSLLLIFQLITITSIAQTIYKTTGTVERYDSSINAILSKDAKAEIIADGFDWSEGHYGLKKTKCFCFPMCLATQFINGQRKME